jgi:hypothetical protein
LNGTGQRRRQRRQWINRVLGAAVLLLASPLMAPQLLAFPYRAKVGTHLVYSEQPIAPQLRGIVERADAKLLAEPLGKARPLDQSIFLTNGSWRWRWLAISAGDALALSRPIGEPVIVNHSDPSRDTMTNGHGAVRKLSDVLAHEMTHGAIRAHFGLFRAMTFPAERVEGYCDHVVGSSTLSDAQVEALIRTGQDSPGLLYWRGRKAVERDLRANGGSVDRLFLGRAPA